MSVVVQGRNHNVGNSFTGGGIITFDSFSFPFTGSGDTFINPDGTFTYAGGVGVLTSETADFYAMGTNSDTVQYCINHIQ